MIESAVPQFSGGDCTDIDMVRAIVPWSAIQDIANETPDAGMARAIARAACAIRRQYPTMFNAIAPLIPPANNVMPAVTRLFWNRICTENPLQPSDFADVGVYGGQCVGQLYTVTGIINNTTLGFPPNNTQQFSITNVIGPIQRVWITVQPGGNGVQRVLNVTDANGTTRTQIMGSDSASNPTISNPRFVINPPDNCGNRPYPTNVPATPFPQTVTVPVTINQQQIDIPVNLPGLDTSGWPDFTFSPTFELGGLTGTITVEGIEISYAEEGVPITTNTTNNEITEQITQTNTQITNTGDSVVNRIENTLQIELGNIEVDFTEVLQKIDCCACEAGSLTGSIVAVNTAGGTFDLPENTRAIKVTAELPFTSKTPVQSGSGDSPDIYFWGSASIDYLPGAAGIRQPLHFPTVSIPCDRNPTSVTIALTYGNRASVIAYTRNCES